MRGPGGVTDDLCLVGTRAIPELDVEPGPKIFCDERVVRNEVGVRYIKALSILV